jgi:hypothetical protein
MGHSPETHQRHYGRWVDEATIDTAMEVAIRYRTLTKSHESVKLMQRPTHGAP